MLLLGLAGCQAEDSLHVRGLDLHEAAEGEAAGLLRPVGHHVRDVFGLGSQLVKGDGHPQGVEEEAQLLDALAGGGLRVRKVHLTAEDPHGELGQPDGIMGQHVLHPGGQDHRKTRAVGAIVEGGELMLDLVAGPVLLPAHAAGVVVGQHPCPHQVRPGGVVIGIGNGLGGRVQHGLQQGLAQPVRQPHVGSVGEVPLHDVGHHVHRAAGGLVGRQGAGEPGVQHGEFRADDIRLGAAPLQVAPLLGDDAAVGPLAAGGGNSQHHAHGQRFLDLGGAGEEIPEIPLVQRAEADGLGGVDDTAAAQCQQEVRAGPPDQVDALVYLAAAGVGLDVGELCR